MSYYGRASLFVGKYVVPEDGHVQLSSDAHVCIFRGLETPNGWVSDRRGDKWLIVEDGDFWPVMIHLNETDLKALK